MPTAIITIVGNLASDPELRFTPNGKPVANFRVGVTEKYRTDSGEWKDRETSWFSVQCWNDLAEHVAETLTRGSRVVVTGVMRQRTYETKENEKRYVWDLNAEDIGVSLRYATAKIHKSARGTGVEDPWAESRGSAPASTGVPATVGAANAANSAGSQQEEPPF